MRRYQRYQNGSLRVVPRANGCDVWELRYRDKNGDLRSKVVGSTEKYPTETAARKAVQGFVLTLNQNVDQTTAVEPTFGALVLRYQEDEMPRRHSTAKSYKTMINRYIYPRWSDAKISDVRPMHVQEWFKGMESLSPKYKGKIRALMHRLLEFAMLWELVETQRNPMDLVEIRGVSKRNKRPTILTVEEYYLILEKLIEPYRTMVIVAMCLGLRVSEILALKWTDINFEELVMRVTRAVVDGKVDDVKTEYSEDDLPLDPDFATELLRWRDKCPESQGGWVFPNPLSGKPFHASPIQQDYIRKIGKELKLGDHIGWHTFRHTYRSLLDDTGAPMGVQQKLMRHAQISTTMNEYGNAYMETKRAVNSKIVKMVLNRPA